MAAIAYEYGATLLKATGVCKTLGSELILRDLDLEIKDIHRQGVTQGQVVGLLGPSGVGKAQPMDAEILTPYGFKRMGDIAVGDDVIGVNGCPVRVLGVFPQGVKPVYKVALTDGSATECCDEHLWLTQTPLDLGAGRVRRGGVRGLAVGRPGTVKPLALIRETLRDHNGKRNHALPLVAPVHFAEDGCLPINPYLMGVLLGDGGLSQNSIRFTCADPEILQRAREALPEGFVLRCVSVSGEGIDYRLVCESGRVGGGRGRKTNVVMNALRELGLMDSGACEKFIPPLYLMASVEDRLCLLRGLMDTDGSRGNSCQAHTSSPRLAHDIKFLVQSLGGVARIGCKTPHYTHKGVRLVGRLHYNITVTLPASMFPFLLARKSTRKPIRPIRRFIDTVEFAGDKECQCILVDAPDHLYVTDEFIVTHNTTLFRLLAGLDLPDSGTILVEEGRPVQRGMVGVVAQNYPLFEHRTVLGNLRVAGRLGHLPQSQAVALAKSLLARFGLEAQSGKYPAQLSGGQRQRVAIAQQFMCSEHFLLMDEPFSGLDLVAEESVCALIREMALTDELKTFILVTHDIAAALSVTDTIWLLGRDWDAQGQIIPGARIQAVYDLAERGVAWQENNTTSREFLELLREIRTVFPKL